MIRQLGKQLSILAGVGVARELFKQAIFCYALEGFSRFLGEVHFIEDGLIAKSSLVQYFICSTKSYHNHGPDSLFAKEVQCGLFARRREYRAAPGCADATRNREGKFKGVSTDIAFSR